MAGSSRAQEQVGKTRIHYHIAGAPASPINVCVYLVVLGDGKINKAFRVRKSYDGKNKR